MTQKETIFKFTLKLKFFQIFISLFVYKFYETIMLKSEAENYLSLNQLSVHNSLK